RSRHTRFSRDWSSDVCSSDLPAPEHRLLTAAWPGQPWLDRKLREGDTLLVTGPVRFFHGRQLQPREYTVLGRGGGERRPEAAPGERKSVVSGERGAPGGTRGG